MKIFLLSLSLFLSVQTAFAQIKVNNLPASTEEEPLQYFGHLEINGLISLKNTPAPNHMAIETKYWLNKSPTLKSSLGFGWQIGFNEGYADTDVDYTIDGLVGNELSYLYNYFSIRYKIMPSQRRIRPYAEIGGGWLFIMDNFVDRPLNPDYDPNHSCDDGGSEYLRNTTLIRAQNRLALDVELGINYQVSDMISLNLGLGSIVSNPIAHLEEVNHPSLLETGQSVTQSYQFKQQALHSTSLKIGIALLLFNDPNVVEKSSNNNCFLIDSFDSSDSCN